MPAKRAKKPAADRSRPCIRCGECWTPALRRRGGLCLNCADEAAKRPHPRLARCPLCHKEQVPGEFHHIATERQHATLGLRVCLNCHAILTLKQVTEWRPSWTTAPDPTRCIVQGLFDVVRLWLQRSHSGWSLLELAKLGWRAFWAVFEPSGPVGWAGWEGA